jgi:GT2 family glycosyltransferase
MDERVGEGPIEGRCAFDLNQPETQSKSRERFALSRPRVHGKFLYVGDEQVWVKGVTYGTFKPDATGLQFPARDVVKRDFRGMAIAGLNAVRVYTTPPRWLLDVAADHGLWVMIGLPWEQHIAFLDEQRRARRIEDDIRTSVRILAGHPAVLCYVVGNEIPASVVRWYGKSLIEKFVERLCVAVKSEDPGALVTYVNFPTTEYLDLPYLDFLAFNVYLESREKLCRYLARLQNLAGERPLVMAEIGLDSQRNGEAGQAECLDWQIATTFEAGCAGAFVFAWTDEWFRGGHDIEDWDFGLTRRDREPKAALRAVAKRFANVPFEPSVRWPRISVVVCSYNGARTIDETLTNLADLKYPDYEVIVIDDGSGDGTSAIARQYDVRLIRTENRGLSAARNQGLEAATGEIVAYIDDDAYPDQEWLTYLAAAFLRSEHVGIGGPNLAVPGDGAIADCVANAPGGPVHVLLSDEVAEHIPGCNMAYRRDKLKEIGGFDSRFWVAGDDVDLCWRLQERGWSIGFAPTAVVWHHRRNSVRAYFRQQRGYAKAEALLAEKWPSKYNSAGHLTWEGRLYGRGVVEALFARSRIYHGVWGSAPFQSIYQLSSGGLAAVSLMPEWYVLLGLLAFIIALGASWEPLLWVTPVFAAGLMLTLAQAGRAGTRAKFDSEPRTKFDRVARRLVVAWLHVLQPAARLVGRVQHGIGPWSWRGLNPIAPVPTFAALWSTRWTAIEARLTQLEANLRELGAAVSAGGNFDRWDLSIAGGLFGGTRVAAMVEEHGDGKQLIRLRAWPKVPAAFLLIFVAFAAAAGLALLHHAAVAGTAMAAAGCILGFLIYADCTVAMSQWREAIYRYVSRDSCLHIVPQAASVTPRLPSFLQWHRMLQP